MLPLLSKVEYANNPPIYGNITFYEPSSFMTMNIDNNTKRATS